MGLTTLREGRGLAMEPVIVFIPVKLSGSYGDRRRDELTWEES